MSLKGQLGGMLMKRIEAMPSVRAGIERGERIAPLQREARRAAHSTADDETAVAELRERLSGDANVRREAVIELSERRRDYIADRSYRLLSAASGGGAVQPIPPERAELFRAEAELGWMPMEEAFRRLVALEPRLAAVEREAENLTPDAECSGLPPQLRERLHGLIGGGARGADELLGSTLATSIVHQYLSYISGQADCGPGSLAFFEHPRKRFVATGVLWNKRTR